MTYTILLVNQTTNDLRSGVVVRHVEPVIDGRVIIRPALGSVKDVASLIGAELDWKECGDILTIDIPRLDEYDAIKVELADGC